MNAQALPKDRSTQAHRRQRAATSKRSHEPPAAPTQDTLPAAPPHDRRQNQPSRPFLGRKQNHEQAQNRSIQPRPAPSRCSPDPLSP